VHAAPCRAALAVTGAGSEAIAWLLRVPGASSTVLEAVVPYSQAALADYLGQQPTHSVSGETASLMAAKAHERACRLREAEYPVLGVGCSGALATTRARRGPERAFVAVKAADGSAACSLSFAKGAHTREEEEERCSRLLIHVLALACWVLPAFEIPLLPGEALARTGALSPVAELLEGRVASLLVQPDGRIEAAAPPPGGILSGALNPLHEGHRQLARVAAGILGAPVVFELSLENVDKPPLSEEEALRRARQFAGWGTLALSRAPTFREKVRLFPGSTFVIGSDTAERVVAPRYYAGEADMLAALAEIRDRGCRFLVAGRFHEGAYRTLADVAIPDGLRALFQEIPESAFRMDVSSTELRERAAREGR